MDKNDNLFILFKWAVIYWITFVVFNLLVLLGVFK